VKGPTGAPERKPFDTRRESTEREWFVVRIAAGWAMGFAGFVSARLWCLLALQCCPSDGLVTTFKGMLRLPVSR
jgi:hypothetical protein